MAYNTLPSLSANKVLTASYLTPASQTGFSTIAACIGLVFGGFRGTSASVASAKWPVGLFAGVYTFQLMYSACPTLGTASVLLGSSTLGEIDMYGAAVSQNTIVSLPASVPTSGSYELAITAGGKKNASSSGSIVRIQAFKIRKTGGY